MVRGSYGWHVINPLIPQLRQHSAPVKSLLGSLSLPDERGEAPRLLGARGAAQTRGGFVDVDADEWIRDTDTSSRLSLKSIRWRAAYRGTVNLSAGGSVPGDWAPVRGTNAAAPATST